MSVGAVQAGELNVILPGVGPVDAVIDEIQRETVGPCDLVLHDDAAVGAVHPDSADVWVVSPVGPVQVPNDTARGVGPTVTTLNITALGAGGPTCSRCASHP